MASCSSAPEMHRLITVSLTMDTGKLMSKGPSDFKMTNIRRAIVGAQMAGIEVGRVEIATNGTVSIVPRGQQEVSGGSKPVEKEMPDGVGTLRPWD
jgi:hypothetical protein